VVRAALSADEPDKKSKLQVTGKTNKMKKNKDDNDE
jgi:hypothetical protein